MILQYDRQLGMLNPNEEYAKRPIAIIGAGTIGSWLTIALAKMGLQSIGVFDFDKIEPHNAANQLYSPLNTGQFKVTVLQEEVLRLTGLKISVYTEKWTPQVNIPYQSIVISAVDDMGVRKELWQWVKLHSLIPLFVDGRTGGNVLRVFAIHPTITAEIEHYESTLIDTSEIKNEELRRASEIPCTMRSIADVSFITAGLMANAVRNHLTGLITRPETVVDLANHVAF